MYKAVLTAALVLFLHIGCAPEDTTAQEAAPDEAAVAEAPATPYEPVAAFDPMRDPAQDLAAAVTEAQRTDKHILLDVGGEWCTWCHRMDRFIEETPAVKETLEENYVVLKINFSPENENEAFLSQYPPIPGYPHLFVLDSDGEFLHSQGTGELEEGDGYSEAVYLAFLEEWAPAEE